MVQVHVSGGVSEECTLVSEIAKARQHLKNSLERVSIFSVQTTTKKKTHSTQMSLRKIKLTEQKPFTSSGSCRHIRLAQNHIAQIRKKRIENP